MSQAVPLRSIQILRAVAACLVVFGHALHETAGIAARTGRPPLNVNVIDWGIGVDIFFVISGFIMIYTTAELFGQPGAMRTFLMRRIIRIVPLYWLMTAGLILTYLLAPKMLNVPIEGWRSIVTSFFFIPDLRGNGEVRPIMALGWSLNYEMFFYAVFAVCLLAPLRRAALYLTGFFVGIAILGATLKPQSIALAYWTNSIVLEFLVRRSAGARLPRQGHDRSGRGVGVDRARRGIGRRARPVLGHGPDLAALCFRRTAGDADRGGSGVRAAAVGVVDRDAAGRAGRRLLQPLSHASLRHPADAQYLDGARRRRAAVFALRGPLFAGGDCCRTAGLSLDRKADHRPAAVPARIARH